MLNRALDRIGKGGKTIEGKIVATLLTLSLSLMAWNPVNISMAFADDEVGTDVIASEISDKIVDESAIDEVEGVSDALEGDEAADAVDGVADEVGESLDGEALDDEGEYAEDVDDVEIDDEAITEDGDDADADDEGEEGTEADEPEATEPADAEAAAELAKAYPAQAFNDSASGLTVDVTAPVGALPAGATMKVKPVEADDTIMDAVADALPDGKVAKNVTAVDITFFNAEGAEIEPLVPIKVKMQSWAMLTADDPVVVHIDEKDDGAVVGKIVAEKKAGLTTMEFNSDKFSVYVVVEQGEGARVKVEFKNGKGSTASTLATMYVKKKDITDSNILAQVLYDPSSELTVTAPSIFKGWTTDEDYIFTPITEGEGDEQVVVKPATAPLTIADVRTEVAGIDWDTVTDAGSDGGTVITYYAMIAKQYDINYVDATGASLGKDQVVFRADDTSGDWKSYTISLGYVPEDDEHSFAGWHGNPEENIQGWTADTLYQLGDTVTIKGDVEFSVDTPEGHWLVFDENGKGATYNAPQFVKSGEVTVNNLLPMQRKGYTFGGWFTNAACTAGNEFSFGHELQEGITVYAKWTAKTPSYYTVIIWKQNISGSGYDFGEAITLQGTTDTTVNTVSQVGDGDSAYVRVNGVSKQYTGFHLTEFDEDVTITPEDNAVVNVYYNRNEYTLTFRAENSGSGNVETTTKDGYDLMRVNNGGSGYSYYIKINGTWYQLTRGTGSSAADPYRVWENRTIRSDSNVTPGGYLRMSRWNNNQYYQVSISSSEYTPPADTGVYKTITALYQQPIGENFPITDNGASSEWRWDPQESSTFNQVLVYIDIMPAENVTFYPSTSTAGTRYMEFYVEALPGQTPDRTWNGRSFVKHGNTIPAKYNFFTEAEDFIDLTGYTKLGSDPAFNNDGEADPGSGGTIRFYYTRQTFTINFMDGAYVDGNGNPITGQPSQGQIDHADGISYEADVSSYNSYTPETTPDGYVFEGWFLDSAGNTPYTFTTMPEGGMTVYAKWRQIQYRVFLHPDADGDSTLDWGSGSQQMNFRVSYGDRVSAPTGMRNGYKFIGWYSDEAKTHMFKAETTLLTDSTVTTSYDKTTHMTDPMDKWGNGATSNSDITGWDDDHNPETPGKDRFWITRELNLYAKWSKTLDGADGIGVLYSLYDSDVDETGSGIAEDKKLYKDNVEATAVPAVTPPDGYVFDYWIMQKWDSTQNKYVDVPEGSKGSVIYAGQAYEVLEANARSEAVVDDDGHPVYVTNSAGQYLDENGKVIDQTKEGWESLCVQKHTYTIQLRAKYKAVEEATPTHISWFNNDGEEAFHVDKTTTPALGINEAVAIQDPQPREGYIFLGWARVATSTSEDPAEAAEQAEAWEADEGNYEQALTAANLLVRYDTSGAEPVYIIADEENEHYGDPATQVAADEALPYHAMFAVWAPIVTAEVTGETTEATFDGAEHTATYTVTYKAGSETLASLDGTGITATESLADKVEGSTISGKNLSAINAGTYTATASVFLNASGTEITSGDTTYIITSEGYAIAKKIGNPLPAHATGTVTVKINPAELTVKPVDASKVYGADDPTPFDYTVTGMQNGDTEAAVKALIGATVTRATGEDVATYTMTATGPDAITNYTVKYETGTFTITAAELTVKPVDASKVYGADDPTPFDYTVTGMQNGDTEAAVKALIGATVTRATGEDVATYTMTATGPDAITNYTVKYETGTFTITAASIDDDARFEITDPVDTTYNGQEQKQPVTITDTVTGKPLVPGEDYEITYTDAKDGDDITDAGEITVTVSGKGNYEGTINTSYTIKPAPVTVTIDDQSKTYDNNPATDPELTYVIEGVVEGEDPTEVLGIEVSREEGQDAGEYAITAKATVENLNYTVTVKDGTFTINPAEYTLKFDPNGGILRGSTDVLEIPVTVGKEADRDFTIIEAPTRTGYTFLYWRGSEYQPGDTYKVEGDHTFTAEWAKNAEKPVLPQTGDDRGTTAGVLGGASLLSLLALVVARRRMREEDYEVA
ncbi:MAG: LPXTG cell wall anchor domain-containing protein [Eggerthellaceae bacterium]|nr:LPXTG cell wall anchor domain-containing protein [Eggerthellaceae bacterium]